MLEKLTSRRRENDSVQIVGAIVLRSGEPEREAKLNGSAAGNLLHRAQASLFLQRWHRIVLPSQIAPTSFMVVSIAPSRRSSKLFRRTEGDYPGNGPRWPRPRRLPLSREVRWVPTPWGQGSTQDESVR